MAYRHKSGHHHHHCIKDRYIYILQFPNEKYNNNNRAAIIIVDNNTVHFPMMMARRIHIENGPKYTHKNIQKDDERRLDIITYIELRIFLRLTIPHYRYTHI